jgi:hypothetical protein
MLRHATSSIRAGLVVCTGNTGCKFALSNTKGTASHVGAPELGRQLPDPSSAAPGPHGDEGPGARGHSA